MEAWLETLVTAEAGEEHGLDRMREVDLERAVAGPAVIEHEPICLRLTSVSPFDLAASAQHLKLDFGMTR